MIKFTLVVWFMFVSGPNGNLHFTPTTVVATGYSSYESCNNVGKEWAKQTGRPNEAQWACVPTPR